MIDTTTYRTFAQRKKMRVQWNHEFHCATHGPLSRTWHQLKLRNFVDFL